jgi:tetratricopeptide (TPR) repeat protein
LGELIVRETMSIYRAQQAINHFCQAEMFDRAGSLFLLLLDQARTLEAGKDIGLVDAMWANLPLPDRMNLNIRLMARGLQLAVLPKYNRPIDYVLVDLDLLMASASEVHRPAVMAVAVLAAVYLARRDPDRTLEYIGRALVLETPPEIGEPKIFLDEGRRLEDLIWFLVPSLDTPPRLSAWLSIVEQIPAERRHSLLSGEDAMLGCIVVADRLRLVEVEKPEEERQWAAVLAALDDLRLRARETGSGVLEGAAIRTLLTIYGEDLRQFDMAVTIAREAIDRLQWEPSAIFMAAGMLGRQYVLAGRHEEARPMLEMALSQPAGERTHDRMMTLLTASECYGAV